MSLPSCTPVPLCYTMRCVVQSSSVRGYIGTSAVHNAFDKSLQHDVLDESPAEPLTDALQPILNITHTGMGTY